MSYKIHCYAHLYNQIRNLGEISLSFIPRTEDDLILDTNNSNYEGKIMGQVINVQIDTTEDEKITCYLAGVRNV